MQGYLQNIYRLEALHQYQYFAMAPSKINAFSTSPEIDFVGICLLFKAFNTL